MESKKLKEKEVKNIAVAAILLVVGVLFCCSLAMTNLVLSYVIGTSIIVAGVLVIVNVATAKKPLLSSEGLIGAAIVAFGILFAGNVLTSLVFRYIPFLLICVGALVIADCIIKFVKERETAKFVIVLIVGALIIALGFCLKYVDGFSNFTALILGIVMIVYAIFMLASVFVKKDKKKESDND